MAANVDLSDGEDDMLPFDELCEAWARADDADEAGELADEVARTIRAATPPQRLTTR